MNHVDPKTIELFHLEAESVKPFRKKIARHLEQCPTCNHVLEEIQSYYQEAAIGDLQETPLLDRTRRQALPEPLRYDALPIHGGFRFRIARSIRSHPLSWSAGIACAAILVLVLRQVPFRDVNPSFARVGAGYLTAYNHVEEVLWRQAVDPSNDVITPDDPLTVGRSQAARVMDVDGDGIREVFAIFGWGIQGLRDDSQWRDVLACFNGDGTERWRYTLSRSVSVGSQRFSDDWRFYQISAGDYNASETPYVLGFASHVPWYPNVVVKLNARTGFLESEYWHFGMFPVVREKDIDNDGVVELVLGGQNNQMRQGCLVILDPRFVRGQGPAPVGMHIEGMERGTERFYTVFPGSDLKPYWFDITNEVTQVSWKSDSTIEVVVRERISPALADSSSGFPYEDCTLYFYFDASMNCVDVRPSDAFSAIREKHLNLGLVRGMADRPYFERLRSRVRYWDGSAFIDKPVMNRLFEAALDSTKR